MFCLPEKMPEPAWLGSIASDEPGDDRPFLLPGVRVRFAPVGTKAFRKGRAAAVLALVADEHDQEGAHDAMAAELLRHGILEWEGVGDADGTECQPSPEWIERFLANPIAFLAATKTYVHPFLERDAEGNASGASPAGTGVEGTPGSDTAS